MKSTIDLIQGNTFPLLVSRQDPQSDTGLHRHNFSELVIICNGNGIHVTEAYSHQIRTGDVFVILGDRCHGYQKTNELSLINIIYDTGKLKIPTFDLQAFPAYHAMFVLEPAYRKKHDFRSHLRLTQTQMISLLKLVEEIESEMDEKLPGYKYNAAALFMRIIVYLSRCYAKYSPAKTMPLMGIGKALSYLEQDLTRHVSLEELCRLSNMSESSLSRAFKRLTGYSPVDYFIRIRIHKACELLRNPEINISEVAYYVGFTDSNYFSRQFLRVTGTTPRNYKKQLQKSR